MTIRDLLHRPSALLPLLLSSAALLTIAVQIARAGTAPQADEGTAAHLWQLLLLVQIPFVAFFALRALPESPRTALAVLGLQALFLAAALAPVALLGW